MIEYKAKRITGGFLVPEISEHPANKWQFFKQRYFPSWLLRIFPVKMITIRWTDILRDSLAEEKIRKYIKNILNKEALKIDGIFMNQ